MCANQIFFNPSPKHFSIFLKTMFCNKRQRYYSFDMIIDDDQNHIYDDYMLHIINNKQTKFSLFKCLIQLSLLLSLLLGIGKDFLLIKFEKIFTLFH